jgi:hypothetical protein
MRAKVARPVPQPRRQVGTLLLVQSWAREDGDNGPGNEGV